MLVRNSLTRLRLSPHKIRGSRSGGTVRGASAIWLNTVGD
jgi:hypothetical protein